MPFWHGDTVSSTSIVKEKRLEAKSKRHIQGPREQHATKPMSR